ncbi:MAG: HPr family phosphocarrier protein [Lachnospiraceae bacterium]|jgi:phosphotransferase system HPr-like phosphotransfer protein|nr:HPr family phosphocarrier protein [Lachnospiraceae bacterium]
MSSVKVLINSFAKARRFHHIISQFDGEFDLLQDRYIVNAKSQLGIFSLDISRPLRLDIHSEDNLDHILETISSFLVPSTH